MTSPHLAVILAGRLVGEVERTRAGVLRLTYAPDARGARHTPVSLSLPTTEGSIAGTKVDSFLWGLLPDSDAALGAIARRHGADVRDPLSLLAAVGKDCAGAVQLCAPAEVEAILARQGRLVPYSRTDVEKRLAGLRMDENAGWTMPGEHWSLGGAQQKFALRRVGDDWFEAQGAQPTSHILKPGIHKLVAQALVEHVSMRAATLAGLNVAHTEFARFTSESAIVVTRFDRAIDEAGNLVRLHQEDLCQALGVGEKYEQHGGPTPASIVRLLRESADTAAQAATNVDAFIDALVLNTVMAAPDAHARNYAVLLDRDSVRLAPLFDVASGLAYGTRDDDNRAMAMSLAGTHDAGRVAADDWLRLAAHNRLDDGRLLERVREIAETIPGAMRTALHEVEEVDGTVRQLTDRLLPALDKHAAGIARRAARR